MSEQAQGGLSRRLKWLLGCSLALNFAVIGLIGGVMLRSDGPGGRFAHAPGAERYAAPYVIAMPRAERREMFRDMRKNRDTRARDRQARRAQYDDVIAALRAEPFDTAALRAAIDAQRTAGLAFQEAVQGAWVARVTGMSAPQRADYADAIEEVLRKGPRRGTDRP